MDETTALDVFGTVGFDQNDEIPMRTPPFPFFSTPKSMRFFTLRLAFAFSATSPRC